MSGERYARIACRISGRPGAIRPASVWIEVGEKATREVNIPRSLIHGGDETRLDGRMAGEALTLQILKWKADELGLTPARDREDTSADLFGDGRDEDSR